MRMDIYEDLPRAQRRYLAENGWHFNKALCDWAVDKMTDRSGNKLQPYSKEQTDSLLKQYNIKLDNDHLYDACYVCNMARADYLGSSLRDDRALAMYIKDYLDDVDGSPTRAMDEFCGKMIGMGCAIDWESVL